MKGLFIDRQNRVYKLIECKDPQNSFEDLEEILNCKGFDTYPSKRFFIFVYPEGPRTYSVKEVIFGFTDGVYKDVSEYSISFYRDTMGFKELK